MRSEHKNKLKLRKRNIALIISYDGTNYNGFQWQKSPSIAVQNVLETQLEKIFGDKIELYAAGRTDAGVHAFGQVVNFFTDGRIEIEKIPIAARSVLPSDIVVRSAREADKNFHALHSAKSKIYYYRILNNPISNPFLRRFAWQFYTNLDVTSMQAALNLIVGTHDFSTFKASNGLSVNPIRTIFEANIFNENIFNENTLTVKIRANGFLYHMVRNIVAAIVAVGCRRLSLEEFEKCFLACNRKLIPATAPAEGLCLQEVFY